MSLRLLFAIVAVICGIYVLVKSAGEPSMIATGIGLIAAGIGLVVP